MLLEIVHHNVFRYSVPVRESYLEFRLTPVTDASQHLLQRREKMSPARVLRQYPDAWGNTVSYTNILGAYDHIEVTFEHVVETYSCHCRGHGLSVAERNSAVGRTLLYDYLHPTPLTAWSGPFLAFAEPLQSLRRAAVPLAVEELREKLYASFQYQGDVTDTTSTIDDILKLGAGVCQDFAHLMIATARYLGLAARYVSGYVLPADGTPAAASHAWCEVFDPDQGWLGVDPTHNCWAEERYVRLGVGRDFRDVPPNRGIYKGQSQEDMEVRVELRPIAPDELANRARALYTQAHLDSAAMARESRRSSSYVSLTQQALFIQQQQQQQQ